MKKKLRIRNGIIIILTILLVILGTQHLSLLSKKAETGEDNMEIERKFLLALEDLPADMETRGDVFEFVQTYINYSPEMRVRKVNDIYHYFTIKLPKDDIGLAREEVEKLITAEEYDELVKKQVGTTIYKTRYQFFEEGNLITVDVYSHDLQGLIVAEVEFENIAKAEKYTPPGWFGKEITSDLRYKNANLARYGQPSIA